MSKISVLEKSFLKILKNKKLLAEAGGDYPFAILCHYPRLSVELRDAVLAKLQTKGKIIKRYRKWKLVPRA